MSKPPPAFWQDPEGDGVPIAPPEPIADTGPGDDSEDTSPVGDEEADEEPEGSGPAER